MKFEEALIDLRKGKEIKSHKFSIKIIDGYLGFTHYTYAGSPHDLITQIVYGEWEAEKEHEKTFEKVFESFKEGKNIRRKSWPLSSFISKEGYSDGWISGINVRDLIENDWELIE